MAASAQGAAAFLLGFAIFSVGASLFGLYFAARNYQNVAYGLA